MRRIAAALVLTALLLAGCGGDDDGDEADGSTTTEAAESTSEGSGESTTEAAESTSEPDEPATEDPSAVGGGTCPYLTPADLEEAFGTPFEEVAGSEAGCGFDGGDLSIQVSRIDIQIDAEQYAEESTSSCDEGTVEEVDAGDLAYACIAIGPTATVFEGDVAINLGVLSADDEQAVVDGFAAVLPSVTVEG